MGFIPYGARSREEYAIQQEFSNDSGKGVLLLILIVAKDNGSMLREEALKEAVEVSFKKDQIIQNRDELFHLNC